MSAPLYGTIVEYPSPIGKRLVQQNRLY
uniref:Uncharacterized protein n=1 Tax=Mesocestoides corti TaxID=53468 RepID=A0A5K3EXR3_MESCO